MRKLFKNYWLSSVVAYLFLIMQTSILLLVFYEDSDDYFRYAFILAVSLI